MRVALISDIHGNLVGLEAALADLEARSADRIVCLGDVAALGPQPVEIVRRLRDLGCPVVMGNADAFQLSPERDPAAQGVSRMIEDIDIWGAGRMEPDDLAHMRSFQPTVEVEAEGRRLLCFHGTPASYDDVIQSWSAPEDFEAAIGDRTHDLFAGGHTHLQFVKRHGDATWINPGSVGLAYAPAWPLEQAQNAAFAEYAIVDLRTDGSSIELHRVPYDVDELIAVILGSDMPHAQEWAGEWRTGAARN